jgi:hypothetical protein
VIAGATARPQLLLQAVIAKHGGHLFERDLGLALVPAWRRLLVEQIRRPRFLNETCACLVHEMIARTYEQEGWTCDGQSGGELQLSSRKFGVVRFVHHVKTCGPGGLVTVDDIQALLRALQAMPERWIGLASTSADFAPRIHHDRLLRPFLPTRLALRHRRDLLTWLKSAMVEYRRQTPNRMS